MVVRAGQDAVPGVNASIDQFVAAALARNLPVTATNHPTAPHSFDLLDDTESSHEQQSSPRHASRPSETRK